MQVRWQLDAVLDNKNEPAPVECHRRPDFNERVTADQWLPTGVNRGVSGNMNDRRVAAAHPLDQVVQEQAARPLQRNDRFEPAGGDELFDTLKDFSAVPAREEDALASPCGRIAEDDVDRIRI
jgi:hypothetical protein